MQLLRVTDQFGKTNRAVGTHPGRCIVGFAWLQLLDLVDGHARTAQQVAAQGQGLGGRGQVFFVAAHDQQDFAVRRIRVVDHLHYRRSHGREFLQVAHERRAVIVGGKYYSGLDGVLVLHVGQGIERDREIGPAPVGLATEVGGQDRSGFLLAQGRVGSEDKRQFQLAAVTRVEKRQREKRQVVLQAQRLFLQGDAAATADIDPQGAVGRVFAEFGVMADKLQAHAVEVRNQSRIKGHLLRGFTPQLVLLDRQHAHQHIVEVDPDMGNRRDQRRRRRVFQLQAGVAGNAVATHAKFHLVGAIDTQQQ